LAVIAAWAAYGRRTLPFRYLLFAPVYLAWKIPLYVALLIKGRQKSWERTARGAAARDEAVPAGEMVLTSGGDGIFPKGLLVGRVTKASPGSELFLNIRVRPAADLSKLEEVLVVTKIDERQAQPDQTGAARAVDILAERLPGVPSKPETDKTAAPDAAKSAPEAATTVTTTKPATTKPVPTTTPTTAPTTAPGTASAKPAIPANPDSSSKTKAPPPQVSVNGDTTPPRKTATSSSASSTAPSAGTAAIKTVSKPVKTATDPKPQPALEDNPH